MTSDLPGTDSVGLGRADGERLGGFVYETIAVLSMIVPEVGSSSLSRVASPVCAARQETTSAPRGER